MAGRRLQGSEAVRENAAQGASKELRLPCAASPSHPKGQRPSQSRMCASGSWMHGSPVIRPRSEAADSSFLSCAVPFCLCLPTAPVDAAADEQTRRARQHSQSALLSPRRHRHSSFRSKLQKQEQPWLSAETGWPAPGTHSHWLCDMGSGV